MVEIGILGANGQVGSEVALHLARRPGVRVTALVRSAYGAVLLRRLGVRCVETAYDDPAALAPLLRPLDVVADFTYPDVPLTDIPGRLRATVTAVLGAMRPGARYLGMSSMLAWGMPSDAVRLRYARVARTSYAQIKRGAERFAAREGGRRGVGVVNLRLGQVHGSLQSVTPAMVDELTWHRVVVAGRPDDPTIAVFASAVAAAVRRCGDPAFPPGTYDLVASPQWTLAELFDYYRERYGLDPAVSYRPLPVGGLRTTVRGWVAGRAAAARGLAEAHLLLRSPALFRAIKRRYRVARAATARDDPLATVTRPYLIGPAPGPVVTAIESSPAEVLAADRELDGRLQAVLGRAD